MQKAIFPGSFDPPTNGHLNLIHRAALLYDKLYVVISVNKYKDYLFTPEERLDMISKLVASNPKVEVLVWDKLIVDYAEQVGAKVIVRGVRALADFEYEFELSMINKGLNPYIETIFIPTDPQYFVLRSSMIKELATFDGDISAMVPKEIIKPLKTRLKGG